MVHSNGKPEMLGKEIDYGKRLVGEQQEKLREQLRCKILSAEDFLFHDLPSLSVLILHVCLQYHTTSYFTMFNLEISHLNLNTF